MWEPRIYWVQKHQNGYPRVYLYVQDHCRSSIDNLRKKPYLCSVGVADWDERQLVPVGMERRRVRLGKRVGKKIKGGAMMWQNTDRGFQLLSGITKMPQSLYFNNPRNTVIIFFFFFLTHPSLILVSYGWWELKMRTNPSNHPRRETHQFWVMNDGNWVICEWKN